MHVRVLVFVIGCSVLLSGAEKKSIAPVDRVVVGRLTFFDFGPPFQYFELISLVPQGNGTDISRVLLTPAAGPQAPAKVEWKDVTVSQSISELLGDKNPCAIPEKAVRKERKRCKRCLVFSGMDVTLRIWCAGVQRDLRMDILDRDMFDPHAATPAFTSWSMQLLQRLDSALGPGVMEKPVFSSAQEPTAPPLPDSPLVRALASGELDGLFGNTTHRASEIYRDAERANGPLPAGAR